MRGGLPVCAMSCCASVCSKWSACAAMRALRAMLVRKAGMACSSAGSKLWRKRLRVKRWSVLLGSSIHGTWCWCSHCRNHAPESASSGRANWQPFLLNCAGIPANPATPAPRLKASSTVSAWSSAWCANSTISAPVCCALLASA